MKKELKVEIIRGKFINRPKAQQVLDFVNSRDIEIVSIIDDRDVYKIFYYER